jgi:GT2 family glycosyltransferase
MATVLAVVLTYNSRQGLEACLAAIGAQSRPPDEVLVVDNCSDEPPAGFLAPAVRVLRLPENTGPAGGHAAGLREFLASAHDLAWVMDDDCAPAPATLAALLRASDEARDGARAPVLFSRALDRATGESFGGYGWLAALVPRAAVEAGGVPREDFFYWAEDAEYFFRLHRYGHPLEHAEGAVVSVDRTRPDGARPAWKYYYVTRNTVYTRWHTGGWSQRRRALTVTARLLARAALRERAGRPGKVAAVARGFVDGCRGRLGKTMEPGGGDRPGRRPDAAA